jgi:hypothetical protein
MNNLSRRKLLTTGLAAAGVSGLKKQFPELFVDYRPKR